jgi:pimeloyl-ACP methyl ester carboxylesterase
MREIRLPAPRGELAALRGGDPTGAPLLCLHGWLDNAASFLPLAPHLAGFDVVMLDLPGHGASAHRAAGYDYAFVDWIHDVLDALDALGWDSAHLLGHSMGGAIASMVAVAAPERVRRLALVEALGPITGEVETAGKRLRDGIAARRRLEAASRGARTPRVIARIEDAISARLQAAPMHAGAARLIVERNLREVPGGWAWRSDPRLKLPSTLRLTEDTVLALLRGIECPALLIAADPAPAYFSPDVRAARIAAVPSLRLEVMAGGHHLHMEQAGVVGPMIAAFLSS